MQKRLFALLSCSLMFLVGFSGCCKDGCSKKAAVTASAPKTSCKKKSNYSKSTKVASLYNTEDEQAELPEIPEPDFDKLTFIDERAISDFDVAQNDLTSFDGNEEAKKALENEISQLVSLWKAQDDSAASNEPEVDFKTLYLDTNQSLIPTTQSEEDAKIALVDDLEEDATKNAQMASLVKKALEDITDAEKSFEEEASAAKNFELMA